MTTVLLTGFEPFGGQTTNPSWTTVQEVARSWSGAESVHVRQLPVDFEEVDAALLAALDDVEPDIVICVGQAEGSVSLSLERVAINIDDARIPDNKGRQPIDEPILSDGPAAYFSSLPIKAAKAALTRIGVPAAISQTAGTYTCNHVFYRLMDAIEHSPRHMRGGFVHVPFSPEQAAGTARGSMAIETMVRGVSAILATALSTTVDAKIVGGSLN